VLRADCAAALATPEMMHTFSTGLEDAAQCVLLVPRRSGGGAGPGLAAVVCGASGGLVLAQNVLASGSGKANASKQSTAAKDVDVLQSSIVHHGDEAGAEFLLHQLVRQGGVHRLHIKQISLSGDETGAAFGLSHIDFDGDCIYKIADHTAAAALMSSTDLGASSSTPKAKRSKTAGKIAGSTVVSTSLVVHGPLNCLSVFMQHADGTITHSKHHLEDAQLLFVRALPMSAPTGVTISLCWVTPRTVAICCGSSLAVVDVQYGVVTETATLGRAVGAGVSSSAHTINSGARGLELAVEQTGVGGQYSCSKLSLSLGVGGRSLSAMLGKLGAPPASGGVQAGKGGILDDISTGSRVGLQDAQGRVGLQVGADSDTKRGKFYINIPTEASVEFLDALQSRVGKSGSEGMTEDDWAVLELLLAGERQSGGCTFSVATYPAVLQVVLARGRFDLLLALMQNCADLSESAAVRLLAHHMSCGLAAADGLQFRWKGGRKLCLELAGEVSAAGDKGSKRKRRSTSNADSGAVELTNHVLVRCMLRALLTRPSGQSYNSNLLAEALKQHMPTTGAVVLLQLLARLLRTRTGGGRTPQNEADSGENDISIERVISWVEACIDAKFTTFVASCSLAHAELTAALQDLLTAVAGLDDNTTQCEQALGLWIHVCRMKHTKEARDGGVGADSASQINIGGACTSLYQVESVFL